MNKLAIAKSTCQYCGSNYLEELIFLGYFPPVNALVRFEDWDTNQEYFPLQLLFCSECFLVQIGKILDSEIVFPSDYPYLSGITKSLVANFSNQSQKVADFTRLKSEDLVIDIASNDGSLLSNYKDKARVLGIEPTDTADIAITNGIPTIKKYFNHETSMEILTSYGQAKVITICNALAHIPNPAQLFDSIKSLLAPNGVFVSESHYLGDLVDTLQFDTIYHEHLRYYSAKFLVNAFPRHNLQVFRIERIDSHGGSIRVWASHSGLYEVEPSVQEFLDLEETGIAKVEVLREFSNRICQWRQEFRQIFASLRINQMMIVGVGAPSRASTLIGFSGLTNLDLLAVAELPGSLKVGQFMPGTRIPVISEEEALAMNPDIVLVLSWHLGDGLIRSLINKGFKGKFLIPLPTPRVIDVKDFKSIE